MRPPASLAVLAVVVGLGFSGCIPYTVGSTAQTVQPNEFATGMSLYAIPNGIDPYRDSTATPIFGADPEVRFGITDGIDVGVRLPSFSGAVVTLKRRLGTDARSERAAIAVMPGLGVVNLGMHGLAEMTVIASARQRETLTPYGGLRVVQVFPLSRGAVSDSPTFGAFIGLRIGRTDFGISPEIGVFHDRSALELRKGSVIVVPAVTLHGSQLLDLIF